MSAASPPLYSMSVLISVCMDRLLLVCKPPNGEPSPARDGVDAATWAAWAGLDSEPHEVVRRPSDRARPGTFLERLDVRPHDPATVAQAALQRLAQRALVDCVGGVPRRYRPLPVR